MTPISPPRRTVPSATEGRRRTEVRAVAADLFLRGGFYETTMNDIADAAGILPGSLYHHFSSKEEIAVELVSAFNEDLAALTAAVKSSPGIGTPERRLRDLTTRTAELGMKHAAAVRLRGYQPPATTTERLATVLDYKAVDLVEAWQSLVEATVASADPAVDAALLRSTLAHLSLDSGTSFPPGLDVRFFATQLCDLLLHGLSTTTPADDELDGSAPMRVALQTVAGWTPASSVQPDDRREILAAARREFARRGYAATTIRDIAEAAQVRMGTMYRRVSSKEAMLTEILGAYSQVLTDGVTAVVETDGSEIEQLDAVAHVLIQATRRFHEESNIVKFRSNSGAGPFQAYQGQAEQRLSLVAAVIARGLENGAFRPIGTPSEIAFLVRRMLWLRYQDVESADSERTQAFLRRSLLRPTLA